MKKIQLKRQEKRGWTGSKLLACGIAVWILVFVLWGASAPVARSASEGEPTSATQESATEQPATSPPAEAPADSQQETGSQEPSSSPQEEPAPAPDNASEEASGSEPAESSAQESEAAPEAQEEKAEPTEEPAAEPSPATAGPGTAYVDATIRLLNFELHQRYMGWRPNDLIVSIFTDDAENIQLGVLEVVRASVGLLKDQLAGEPDASLDEAQALLQSDPFKFWLPSAESAYDEALEELKAYLGKLESAEAAIKTEAPQLKAVCESYRELLRTEVSTLLEPDDSWLGLDLDDQFYHARGTAKAIGASLEGAFKDFSGPLDQANAREASAEILDALKQAQALEPWYILDGSPDGFLASHRAGLARLLADALYKLDKLLWMLP